MIDSQTVTLLIQMLAGPASAVVVLMVLIAGAYQVTVAHGIPLVRRLGERHLEQIDRLLEVQREESKTIAKALQAIERSLGAVDRRLARLEELTDAGQYTAGKEKN